MSPDMCKDCKKEIGMAEWYCSVTIDGEIYCRECIEKHPEYCYCKHKDGKTRWYFNHGLYRVSHTFSSLYDGPHEYLTSLKKIEELYAPIRKVVHYPEDPMMFNWGFGLTGHIDSEHYRISAGEYWWFFVFEPSKEDLELMKVIGIEEKEKEGP